MVAWLLLPESFSNASWDALLSKLPGRSVFQTSAWAEHKKRSGWTPVRFQAGERAAAQFLMKRYPATTFLWCRGGPAGDPASWDAGLQDALARAASGVAYARFCSYEPRTDDAEDGLRQNGWSRPLKALNRNTTFLLDLSPGEADLRKKLSSNWGHNLRRAEKRCGGVRLWEKPSGADLAAVYRAMEGYKGLDAQYGEAELASLLECLGESALLYRADDEEGRPVALRACAVQDAKAWDLLAASTAEGRKRYASYALLWALLKECASHGVKTYDLGGADPDKAKGVHDFKMGTGARFVEYLGEWDWARPALARPLLSAAAGMRGS